jgi:hypothetical protein
VETKLNINYIRTRSGINKDAYDILYEEAAQESAEYIRPYISEAIITDEGWWNVAANKIEIDGLCLEFGVHMGVSINYFSNAKPNITWYGFDSFEGFQEDWKGGYFGKASFSLNGKLPIVNKNVKLIKGWFKNTLPDFLKEHKEKIAFINMDCDTYESTKQVLDMIGPERLVPNTKILFDEYISYIGWKHGEFKAWQEFVKNNNIKYKYELFGPRQTLIKIVK